MDVYPYRISEPSDTFFFFDLPLFVKLILLDEASFLT